VRENGEISGAHAKLVLVGKSDLTWLDDMGTARKVFLTAVQFISDGTER
jgi:hypothetical protein